MGKEPHLILAFKDYANHEPIKQYKQIAKAFRIPFVSGSGGFWALVAQAQERGYRVSPIVKKVEGQATPPVEPETKPSEPEAKQPAEAPEVKQQAEPEVKGAISQEMQAWIDKPHPASFEVRVKGDKKVHVINTKSGLSLVMKGQPLEFALELVKQHKMGTGLRGSLTDKEARKVMKKLESLYGLKACRIGSPRAHTIVKQVGWVLGTLTEPQKILMSGKKPKKKKKTYWPKKLTPLNVTDDRSVKQQIADGDAVAPTRAEPKDPLCRAYEDGPTKARCMGCAGECDERLADYKDTPIVATPNYDPHQKIAELYERLLDARTENAAFMEQISQLEGALKRKDAQIKALEEKVTILAR